MGDIDSRSYLCLQYVSKQEYISKLRFGDIEKGKMALTDAQITALKPRTSRYLVSDGRGLSLDVLPSGKVSWLYRYRLNASYEKVTLGRYPDLTLKAARQKRDELAAQVADGKSPAQEIKKAKAGGTTNPTVREFGERYFQEQARRNWKNPSSIRRYLNNEIYPTLGDRLLKEITALDVQAIVYRKRDKSPYWDVPSLTEKKLKQAIDDAFSPHGITAFLGSLHVRGAKIHGIEIASSDLTTYLAGGAFARGDTFDVSFLSMYQALEKPARQRIGAYYQSKIEEVAEPLKKKFAKAFRK